MTEADAIRDLSAANQEQAKKFCPMAQRNCIPTCVCYEPGRVAKLLETYSVTVPYCKHPFVEGYLVVNVEG